MKKMNLFRIILHFLIALAQQAIEISSTDPNNLSSWDGCLPSSKIIKGTLINITEAPFILQMEMRLQDNPPAYFFACGASILTENVALTASHCTSRKPLGRMTLRSGSSTRGKGHVHYVREIVEHEPSNDSHRGNDIALVFVKNPFIFSDTVQPIKLPTKELKAGTLAKFAGYGSTESMSWSDLREATIPIVDRKICNIIMEKEHNETFHQNLTNIIDENKMCAGYVEGKVDTCKGDSGGPLYHEGTIYGVVSWGIGCALKCLPGVYTNVYKYLDWINKTIAENAES